MDIKKSISSFISRVAAITAVAATVVCGGAAMAAANDGLAIGSMKLSLMPEYDSQAVLVIQEGKFADRTAFPASVTFTLPKEVTKLTDVCSLSPGGHHFCQIFEIHPGKEKNFVNVKLPYSDFFIDYQYAPFTAKKNSQREFSFDVDTTHDIINLEVNIQQPYRSDKFSVTPKSDDVYEKDGFTVYRYKIKNVKAGEKKEFKVTYFKADTQPSVDIKFSAMSSPGIFHKHTGEFLLAGGLAALAVVWFFRRRKAGKKGPAS